MVLWYVKLMKISFTNTYVFLKEEQTNEQS